MYFFFVCAKSKKGNVETKQRTKHHTFPNEFPNSTEQEKFTKERIGKNCGKMSALREKRKKISSLLLAVPTIGYSRTIQFFFYLFCEM